MKRQFWGSVQQWCKTRTDRVKQFRGLGMGTALAEEMGLPGRKRREPAADLFRGPEASNGVPRLLRRWPVKTAVVEHFW